MMTRRIEMKPERKLKAPVMAHPAPAYQNPGVLGELNLLFYGLVRLKGTLHLPK